MSASAAVDFELFLDASEVDEVLSSFETLLSSLRIDPSFDLNKRGEFSKSLRSQLEPSLSYSSKRILVLLAEQIDKRGINAKQYCITDGSVSVLISGAGPCGLRAAVECALLGMKVTVVDKRTKFSRANILSLWPGTCADLVSLGAKLFFPEMKTHGGLLHLGTREIQLCLLKSALLLGVKLSYATEIKSLNFGDSSWSAILKKCTDEVKLSDEEKD